MDGEALRVAREHLVRSGVDPADLDDEENARLHALYAGSVGTPEERARLAATAVADELVRSPLAPAPTPLGAGEEGRSPSS